MRSGLRLALCTLAAATLSQGLPETASAQDPQNRQTATAEPANGGTKRPLLAAGLEWFIPFAGHAYAGDAGRGLAPNALRIGGMVVVLASTLAWGSDCVFGLGALWDDDCQDSTVWPLAVVVFGGGMFGAGQIWAPISASRTADDHNRALRERVGLSVRPRADRLEVAVLLRH